MNIERINDVIDAYSRAMNITTSLNKILKELLPKLISKYSKFVDKIPVGKDNSDKYIFKPIDGKYSVEDLLLNRLMRNILELKIGQIEGFEGKMKGGFTSQNQSIELDIDLIERQIDNVLSRENPNFEQLKSIATKKVIMHEFEHGLQTQYKPNTFIHPFREKMFKKVFDELYNAKGGKYRTQMYTPKEIEGKIAQGIAMIDEVKHNGLLSDTVNHTMYDNINEIFNETESLEMANAQIQDRKEYPDGTYFNRRNHESSNCNITNYGDMIKVLLGEKWTFIGMYVEPEAMFERFNKRYADFFNETPGTKQSAFENLVYQINKIKENNLEEDHLHLQEVLAKCFERKVQMDMQKGDLDIEQLKREYKSFKSAVITSDDKNVQNKLKHVQVLKGIHKQIKDRINLSQDKPEIFSSDEIGKNTIGTSVEKKDEARESVENARRANERYVAK